MAGAVIGEVGVTLFMAGAACPEILGDSRSAKACNFSYKMRRQDGTGKLSEAVGARRRVFILAEAIDAFCAQILNPAIFVAC